MRPFDPSTSSGHCKLRDFPNPKFVELVETNPEVTVAFAPHPGPSTMRILLYVTPLQIEALPTGDKPPGPPLSEGKDVPKAEGTAGFAAMFRHAQHIARATN